MLVEGADVNYLCGLQVELLKVQSAISIACRLGFATRLPNPYDGMDPLSVTLCHVLVTL